MNSSWTIPIRPMCPGCAGHLKSMTRPDIFGILYAAHCQEENNQEIAGRLMAPRQKMEYNMLFLPSGVLKKKLPDETSIDSAELCAILANTSLLLR